VVNGRQIGRLKGIKRETEKFGVFNGEVMVRNFCRPRFRIEPLGERIAQGEHAAA
jgi:hypothetical protein